MNWRDLDMMRRLAAMESEQQFVALLSRAQPEYKRERAEMVRRHAERVQRELLRMGLLHEQRT